MFIPQMSPLLWLNLYLYSLVLFTMIIIKLYFIYISKFKPQSKMIEIKNFMYKFKW